MTAKLRSMRARMTSLFALFVAFLMFVGGAATLHREERRAEKRSREILVVAVERAHDEVNEAKNGESLLEITQASAGEISAGGLVLVVYDGRPHVQKVVWSSTPHAPQWPAVSEDWRVRAFSYRGQTLILAQEWKPIAEDLQETASSLWQLGILVVAATAVAAWFVVGKTLSPLDRLAAQARNASIDGLQVRLASPSSDAEMRYLTQTLNDLLARIEKESQMQGRFYAAASHELRTPIQSLLGQIDVARSRPRSVASHEELLEELQTETERLATLVQDLLQLNSLEMRQNQAMCETLNLAYWAQLALSQQAEAIANQNLTLDTNLSDANIQAPVAHVEMLLRNLMENATKYATPGTRLTVETQAQATDVQLRIWNACEVSDQTQIENWFEPFYRPDDSRNSQTGGNGLGLSIVAALARANGWKIELRACHHGVEAAVTFPAA